MTDSDDRVTDQGKLLFGAGFVFGVLVTLSLLGVVLVAVAGVGEGAGLPVTVVGTLTGGLAFTAIVGVGLYYLSFPENRTRLSVDREAFGLDDEQ